MELSVEHIHKRSYQKHKTLILLLLPGIVFFLTLSLLLTLNVAVNKTKIANNPKQQFILGEQKQKQR